MMTLVATLTVRSEAIEAFHAFERAASRVMARHGGAIERTVVERNEAPGDLFREVHIITFPDRASFDAYRSDEELARASHLRERAVVATEILIGEDGPDYSRDVE